MNEIPATTTHIRDFIEKHKTKLAVAATATLCLAIHRRSLKQHEDFMEERGLLEEFYTPEI